MPGFARRARAQVFRHLADYESMITRIALTRSRTGPGNEATKNDKGQTQRMTGTDDSGGIARSGIAYLAGAVLLSLLVWLIAHGIVSRQERQSFDDTAAQANQIAVFFERHVLGIFQYGDSYLKLVRREYQQHYDIGRIEALMAEVPLNKSIASHITIIDADGKPLLVSGHKIKPGSSARDRDYFVHQKMASGDELYISKPHKGRNSGKLIVRLVRRYDNPDGSFGGVMFVALEAKHITEFFNTMQIGPKSSATLVGSDKYIRARSTYGPKGPGQDISGSRIWDELAQSPVGLYLQTSVVDGVTRYYSYRRVPDYPLIVAIGLSVDDFQRALGSSRFNQYSIAVLVTLLIVVTSLFFFRQQQLMRRIEASNAELQSQNAELERFAYTVSHDLKAPLVTIKGFLGLLQKDLDQQDRDAADRDAMLIGEAANEMTQLLDELLELSRIGRQMAAPERRNVGDLAHDAIERLAIQLDERGIDLDIADDLPDVYGDPGRLLEVFQNLLDNAIKFMGEQPSPRIEVNARRDGRQVHCTIRDNGTGIAAEYQHRVFDLFDRLDPKVEGTGIGLALVKRIVEAHGGEIRVESDGPGQGTTFHFTLPAAD